MELIKLGTIGPAVAEIRYLLTQLGYLTEDKTDDSNKNIYDESTYNAVMSFQQHNGLLADGIVNSATLYLLKGFTYNLGSRVLYYSPQEEFFGKDVLDLQTKLHDLGFYSDRLDARFGKSTHKALSDYQHEFGLKVDGILGPKSCDALNYLNGLTINSGSLQAIHTEQLLKKQGPFIGGKLIAINPSTHHTSSNLPTELLKLETEYLWDIAACLKDKMASVGVNTVITNEPGEMLSDAEVAFKANTLKADILISLHTAFYRNEKPCGIATFHFGNSNGLVSVSGEKLARLIQRELASRTNFKDDKYHGRTWEILRLAKMPTLWIDAGYFTNPTDRETLSQKNSREKIAESILIGIKRYYLLDKDPEETGVMSIQDLLAEELEKADFN